MEVIQVELKNNEKIAFLLDLHMDSQTPSSRVDDIKVTLIDKLKDVLDSCIERNVKHMFLAGDVFNRISCTHESVNLLGNMFLQYKMKGIELYSILGNHDIVRNNLESIDKSPIQTLFSFDVLKHISLDTRVIINKSVMITPVDYTEYPVEADKNAKYNILLAHMFYKTSDLIADSRHNLSDEDVKKLGYDMMVLGHDHCEYPLVEQDNTLICRFGSVLRGTAHDYNFTRKPKFMVLNDINNISKDTIEFVPIKCRDYEMVASEYVINKKQLGSMSGLQDVLSNLADKLAESGQSDGDRIYDIIKSDTQLPNDCRELLLKYINEVI